MSYVALYRRFRPSSFDEVKGQDHVVKTLKHQVMTGRLQHAYLFCGTRGSGKTSVAKILARAVNCENPAGGSPCGECESCRAAAAGTSVNITEIDAASNNGVDSVRELVEEVQYRPVTGRYKVYIIDEVHMMTGSAFNALLKTLEEPPEYVIFILATTEAAKIPITILSRCQRYDFRRIGKGVIFGRLREIADLEGISADDAALFSLAEYARGSMRDALSLLDRCVSFYADRHLTAEGVRKALGEADRTLMTALTRELFAGRGGAAVRLLGKALSQGMEVGQFAESYILFLEHLLILAVSGGGSTVPGDGAPESGEESILELSASSDPETLLRYIRILSALISRMRNSSGRRVLAEIALIQMAEPRGDPGPDSLPGRIRIIEEALDGAGKEIYSERIDSPRGIQKEAVPPEESLVLPDAAPEDLKMICAKWKHLISALPEGPLRTQLRADAFPQYNADTLENKLYVEFRSTALTEQMDRVLVDHDDYREELEKFLENRTGKRVGVEFHLKENRSPGLVTVDLDRQLSLMGIEFELEED